MFFTRLTPRYLSSSLRRIQAATLFLLCAATSDAQDCRFTAGVDKNPVAAGDRFQVTFTLNATGRGFQAPAFRDFSVLSGPAQSTSMQIVNGSVSQSLTFTYALEAIKEGKFTVGAASIECGGKRVQTNPFTIEVVKGTPRSGGNAGSSSGSDVSRQIADNLFIKVSASKTTVLRGEGITVTYKLFTRVSLANFSLTKIPALNGFWSQDIDMPRQADFHQENVNGVTWNVADLKKTVLFPQYAGNLQLDAMEGDCVVRLKTQRQRSNDFFDQFFNDPFFGGGYRDVEYKVKSSPVTITVKELPDNAPGGFNGAVGNFSMECTLDKPETKANEPVNLKIKITGKGNLKLIEAPPLSFPPDIESYDPKTSDNVSASPSGVSGSRVFEYLLIPRHAGEYKIEPFAFSYFDPDKKEYTTLHTPEFILKVGKGSGSSASVVSGVSKEDIRLLGKDIRYIKTGPVKLRKKGEYIFGTLSFYLTLLAPAPLLGAFLFMLSRNRRLRSNLTLLKKQKATRAARKRLASAKQFLKKEEKEKFYDEIFRALWGYASDKLGIPVSGLSKETTRISLAEKQVNEELINKFVSLADRCEFARFAPGGSAAMQEMYSSAMDLITELEGQIES